MNFEFYNPTRVIFGAGTLARLGETAAEYGSKALIVTGGGSVKRNGIFERAVASLTDAGLSRVECSGVEPNPQISTVRHGAETAERENCDLVIALGGGSTIDAAKMISAAVYYDGDPWDMIFHGQAAPVMPAKALPVIAVPTLAATGSEMNMSAVISNSATKEKSFCQAPCLYPRVALLDPELTLSVPGDQTAYGVCDLITHITEGYLNGSGSTPIQDRFAEGVILTAMEWGPKAIADGTDLEARTQIMWAATVALNGWLQAGAGSAGFPVHMIEHTLSGFHDITHAAGLSAINPSWMRFAAKHNPAKFVRFSTRIFGIAGKDGAEMDCAMEGIRQFELFLERIGCPTRLGQLGIDGSRINECARETLRIINDGRGCLPGLPPMSEADIVNMLKTAL